MRISLRKLVRYANRQRTKVKAGETIARSLRIPGQGPGPLPEPRQANLRSEQILDELRAERV